MPTKQTAELVTTKSSAIAAFELDYNDAKIMATLQATVARGTTPEEYWIFANYCRSTRLNPLKNEVWCIKVPGYTGKDGKYHEGRLQIMTGIKGYLTIANSHPQFDGMKVTIDRPSGRGAPRAATCLVYRKDRSHPHEATVYFEEYYRPGFNGKPSQWEKAPCTMLEKVAKAHALQEAFPQELNGLNIEEEMPPEYSLNAVVGETEPEPAPAALKQLSGGEVRYAIAQPTRDQELYMTKRGAYKDADGTWIAPSDLGPRLEKYRYVIGKSNEAPVQAENNSEDADWMKHADEIAEQCAKEMRGE